MPIKKMEIVFAYDATQPGKQGDPTALKAEDQNGEELNLQLDAPDKPLPPGVLPIYTTGFTILEGGSGCIIIDGIRWCW